VVSNEKKGKSEQEGQQPCTLTMIRAAHTPPHRQSTVSGEKMNQFAELERGEAQPCTLTMIRAAHTPPHRLSTVLGEKMSPFADCERGKITIQHAHNDPGRTHFPASPIDSFG
jgi:hypothetical protein